jgi:hypothetical protein
MQPSKLSRQEREQQLCAMLQTQQGKQEVERLFFACFPPGVMPPVGSLMIQTILEHEYGSESGDGV